MNLDQLLDKLNTEPSTVDFSDVMQVIDTNYNYTPANFKNGDVTNLAGTNEGSCKIFSFAQLHTLNESQTLACFGDYYRSDVLLNPDGSDHGNIRNFIKTGWQGIQFDSQALIAIT
ncbi:type III effector [Psychrosphaera saromensis]|jgi:hypothetical protein|uniref:Type III effector n=1 Tax=Psychrosphaera saromensis TaxID=716813 RepID=A0A2S7UY86_9GAMM|nr:HopJ type III effector protein [Psychrosphaera saromensis]PQJ54452.1 type III effector [Psychrosphaera saromensis]GHB59834.1 type III effector [Psychrosphaera saromensis]GLQ14352.1 type III effector [Psychrosphaera saromensis]